MQGRRNIKVNLYISDEAWEGLKQRAYETHYVRSAQRDDRPRGMSAFVGMLSMLTFEDTRPEYLVGTGQWMTGVDPLVARCLELTPQVVADLGHLALKHEIFPYKCQLPVANGFRRDARPPILHAVGDTPRGATSVKALAGPVLNAIGLGYLTAVIALPPAPPDLYQGPSRRAGARALMQRNRRSLY